MSELCLSSTTKTTTSLLLSDFFLFCSFILSHPLYFSYFIFFSPYLLKLLSFLSPLFITTSLLLLALLTLSPTLHHNSTPQLLESKVGFFLSTYHALVHTLKSKTEHKNEEFHQFDELEACRIVFDTSIFDVEEIPFQDCSPPLESTTIVESLSTELGKSTQVTHTETTDHQPDMEAKSLEGFLQALDEFESMTNYNVEEKKIESKGPKPDKVEGQQKEESIATRGSEATLIKIRVATNKVNTDNGDEYTNCADNGGEYTSDVTETEISSRTLDSNLGSYGSMRREKEWKRTLACKLFEERHNVEEGGEGMDLLWETYEMDSSKNKGKAMGSMKKKGKNKGESEYYEDDEYDEELDGQLCCLQALKFSARKMNLGMGRPNLVKFSKAIKGIGWLHRVTSTHGSRKR
ncbi:uncharacterized protein LOC132269162 [Cornus florida]|uniref:uncharacterized protein LOC132269162 n=1 Tax=Cornus florida TaxID=4283 RepID=UPI00289A4E7F|nr:uncharacterized protein LOC132269162 [Cornus florida]